MESSTLLLVLCFWLLCAAEIALACWLPSWSLTAFVLYMSSVLACILMSFLLAVPTFPKSRKPFMQALWYTFLVGAVPAAIGFGVACYLHLADALSEFFENLALCLAAITLLALWVGGTDFVGIWGLQPLAQSGLLSWTPVAYLQSTILWLIVVYNLTHVIGNVELSVFQDLPLALEVVYLLIVLLWLVAYLRVLCTRPGHPKDVAASKQKQKDLFCVFCQSQKPQRCRHCTKCGACVLRMDHHCPWLRQCIGFANYKFFVTFLTYSAIALMFKAVTLLLFTIKAFHQEITFTTKLWLLSTDALVIALAGTLTAFATFHLYLSCRNLTTIEFLTRHEKSEKKISYDRGLYGNLQSTLGTAAVCWLIPACPPDGDGWSFPHSALDVQAPESQRILAMEESKQRLSQRSETPSQPCLPSTAEPTCIEQQQDGCVAAEREGEAE